jgi:hypothetical protein
MAKNSKVAHEYGIWPDPLVGDGHEPGRWGPRGTHISQAPERGVGTTTLEKVMTKS